MSKFEVEVNRHYTYKVTVEAEDEFAARELVRDFEIEDLEPFETDAWFDFGIAEEVDVP
jgi:hypothetical protein